MAFYFVTGQSVSGQSVSEQIRNSYPTLTKRPKIFMLSSGGLEETSKICRLMRKSADFAGLKGYQWIWETSGISKILWD